MSLRSVSVSYLTLNQAVNYYQLVKLHAREAAQS